MRSWTNDVKAFPHTPDLQHMARRCVWFRPPDEALNDPIHLIAHVLTYGMPSDVRILRGHVSDDDLRQALENAPSGIIDARSWSYWRLVLDLSDRPLPKRSFGTGVEAA